MPDIKSVLCVPGDFSSFLDVEAMIPQGFELELEDTPDPRMPSAFSASRCGDSLSPEELTRIAGHKHVAYVVHPRWAEHAVAENAHTLMQVGTALLDLGGIAVKVETGGVAHSGAHWRELTGSATSAVNLFGKARNEEKGRLGALFWASLREAFVHRFIGSDEDYHTCGMQLLGRRDVIVSRDAAEQAYGEHAAPKALALLDGLASYVLAEQEVRDGHTFRLAENEPRYRVTFEPCRGYEADELLFNPYGRMRLNRLGA